MDYNGQGEKAACQGCAAVAEKQARHSPGSLQESQVRGKVGGTDRLSWVSGVLSGRYAYKPLQGSFQRPKSHRFPTHRKLQVSPGSR